EVTIYPEEIPSRIRGIQVHNRDMEEVRAGLRTAINLQGVEKSSIKRGDVVATADSLRPTFMVDVFLNLLASAPKKLKNRAKARFHTGTAEILGTVVLLDRDELAPGQSCYAQIRLDNPTAVLKGDRFVLRSYSPVRTIGGGLVLHPLPKKKKRFSDELLKELKILHKGTAEQVVEEFVKMERYQGLEKKTLQFLSNLGKKKLGEALGPLQTSKKIIEVDKEKGTLMHSEYLDKVKREILDRTSQYHKQYPLRVGLPKEELRSQIGVMKDPKLFNFALNQLTKDGIIVQEKELIRVKEHKITLAEDQKKTREKLEKIYLESGLQPPYFKDVKRDFPGNTAEEVLQVMVKDGILVKVKEDLYFHRDAIEDLQRRLVAFLKDNGEITTPQFKDMTGASRKYTIPLIEYFDKSQVTVRVGDNRVLRKK
ncbi:MAG: selenocysteine-specific translation factor, partial [Deltaproteobacteria bacterium]